MSVKYFVFTDKPGRTGKRVKVIQNSTGYILDSNDWTFQAVPVGDSAHEPTESPAGTYTFLRGDPWTDDTYRAYYYRTSALADSPQVAVIALVSDAEPVASSSIVAQEVRDAMLLAPTPGVPAGGSIDDILSITLPGEIHKVRKYLGIQHWDLSETPANFLFTHYGDPAPSLFPTTAQIYLNVGSDDGLIWSPLVQKDAGEDTIQYDPGTVIDADAVAVGRLYFRIITGVDPCPAGSVTMQESANNYRRLRFFLPYIPAASDVRAWVGTNGELMPYDSGYGSEILGTKLGSAQHGGAGASLVLGDTNVETALDGLATTLGTPADTDLATDIANISVSVDMTSIEDNIQDLEDKIDLALSTGTSITTAGGSGSVSSKLIVALFNILRPMLKDDQAKVYKNSLLVHLYNRVTEEINSALMQLSSDVAMDKATITGDGTNYTFALPANFLAFVPSQVRPRSPATATSNYQMGDALTHSDQFALAMTQIPTTVSAPSAFVIVTSGNSQYIRFNSIPVSGEIIDALYYYKPVTATESNISTESTPWLGLLDSLILRMLEHYCREGLEFTNEARALWVTRTMADAAMLLGLRHLQTNIINPSSWKKVPRR